MKMKLLIYLALSIITCNLNLGKVGDENEGHEFVFEGSEPFWNMEIKKNNIKLNWDNRYNENVLFSKVASRGETFGFSNKRIYGIINKCFNKKCEYAITDNDSLSYEIIFVYKGHTLKGCGERRIK